MGILKELIQEILPDLDVRIIIDTYSLCKFYESKGYGDNSSYHKNIWRPHMCDYHMNSKLTCYSKFENPENEFEELINEFLDEHPELGGSVNLYFS